MDHVVGIDVSKDRLDAFCLSSGRRLAIANDETGIGALVEWVGNALFVMEAGGAP